MSRISYIAVVAIMTVVFLASGIQITKAEVGPVHVELNTIGFRSSGVRANSVTAFKIHIRFNVTIKSHDWIKIWFPIDEVSCDPKDICNGLPKITGDKEHSRFVPNEKYFAKYPNSELKKYGQIYEVLEDRKGNTRFDECECATDGNCCAHGKCRIVPDPSGLGCWIMGTVLPQLPRDSYERMHRLAMILRSTSLGYTLDDSQGWPFLINTCDERSYQFNTPLVVDPWRKGYNPIDFNTSKATGILAPATPGRYALMVATQPEPTPVESEAFVLPCSQITPPKVEFLKMNPDYPAPFKVKFTTGEGGALDKDSSNITIKFPKGFQFAEINKIKLSSIMVNGQKVTKKPLVDKDNGKLVFTCPVDIDSFSDVEISVGKESGIKTPVAKGIYKLEVCTDSEPEFIPSNTFEVDTIPSAIVTPNTEFFDASYSLLGVAPKTGIDKGSEISINFPYGTYLPPTIDPKKITINNVPCEIIPVVEGTKLHVKMPIEIKNYIDIEIDKCGITNPYKGNHVITYSHKEDIFEFGNFEIKASEPYIKRVDLTNYTNCEQTGVRILYYPSTSTPIKKGDKITIDFPSDFKLPKDGNVQEIKVNHITPLSIEVVNNSIHMVSGSYSDYNGGADIVIGENFGIKNSNYLKAFNLIIIQNGAEVISPDILLKVSQPKTEIEVKWPEDTKIAELGGYTWRNKPPVINFYACNPNQWIYYYFSNKSKIQFVKEFQLDDGIYLSNLHYFGSIEDYREEIKTVRFAIDSSKTICNIGDMPFHFYTNEMSHKVLINRHFETIDNRISESNIEKEYIIDGLKINNEVIANPEISVYSNDFNLKLFIEKSVALKEGDNIIEIASFDQFGDSDTKKITVTRDTKPPQMNIKNPNQNSLHIAGEEVEIVVETEADAEIDLGKETNIENILENGTLKTYKVKLPVKVGKNEITVGAHDRAGNWTTKKLVFYGILPMVSEFWLGATNWTLNGKEQAQTKSPPTNSSPPLPKDLAGSTFMPVAEIGFALSAKISWDSKTKKVTLSQSLPNGTNTVVEVWIGNKKAKVNGKDARIDNKQRLYPAIVNGKTMLPLRFVAENLGADVAYDAPRKKITVNFPSAKIIGK